MTSRQTTESPVAVMAIGRIVGAFGIHGEAKVELLTDFPDRFKGLKQVFLGPQLRVVTIDCVRSHKGRILIKLQGVDTPEAVDALRNTEISIPRADAVELPEDHYYLEDVIGCRVVSDAGEDVGQVTDVLRTGSNDVFVVGSGRDAILIPVIKDAVDELNIPERRIVVQGWALQTDE